ncbi:unnamed protein product [Closterium sp. NIES-64]|nr:unnamed protein product [Closterium sp. NIES-64]
MRADIVEHALKRLIPTLERSGVMVPHQDPPLSKRVNKPVSPELAEIDAKLRDAVGDIHNISCRVGYCEKDITKLELLVESLTNDLSTTRDELTALSAQVAALPAPPQQGRIGGAGGPSARTDDPATQQILAPTAQLEQQGDSHQIQTAHGVINGLLPGTPGDALTSYRCVARGGALPAPSEDHSGCMGPPPPPSHSVGGVVGSGEYADQQQAARAFVSCSRAQAEQASPGSCVAAHRRGDGPAGWLHGRDRAAAHYRTRLGAWERWRVELASLGGANPTPASPLLWQQRQPHPQLLQPHLPRRMQASPLLPWLLHLHSPPLPVELLLCTSEQLLCLRGLLPPHQPILPQATLTNPPVQADVVAFASLSLPESDEGDVGNNATTHPTGIDLLQRGVLQRTSQGLDINLLFSSSVCQSPTAYESVTMELIFMNTMLFFALWPLLLFAGL